MPAERVAMRQAREIIRLKFSADVATREIARRLGLAPSTVRETLKRNRGRRPRVAVAERDERRRLGDGALCQSQEQAGSSPSQRAGVAGGPSGVEAQARHPADRLDEYIAANPGGYSYSRYVAAQLM